MSSRGGYDRERVVYDREYDFDRERGRIPRYEDDRYMMRGGRGRDHSDERYDRRPIYEEDIYRERPRYHDDDPRLAPRREPEPDYGRRVQYRDPSPRRPPNLRRPSSLDALDRAFRHREEYPPPARREDIYRDDFRAPPYVPIPLPKADPGPPPRRHRHYEDVEFVDRRRDDDDLAYGAPERVREREIVRTRKRDESAPRRRGSSRSSSTSSSSSSTGGTTVKSEYPKRGKTRIPAKLVSKRAIIDLEYPFIEEGTTIIVLKALGQDNIDELLKRSDEYKKSELEVIEARSSAHIENRKEEIVIPVPAAPAPPPQPQVRILTPPPPAPVVIAQEPHPAPVIIDAAPRSSSPASSYDDYHHHHHHGHHHHHHSHPYDHHGRSETVDVGPLALAGRSRSQSRSRKDIRAEIKALQNELALRPKADYDRGEIVRAERLPDGQLVVYDEQIERIETGPKPPRIEKDKKGPPPRLMRAMLATLT